MYLHICLFSLTLQKLTASFLKQELIDRFYSPLNQNPRDADPSADRDFNDFDKMWFCVKNLQHTVNFYFTLQHLYTMYMNSEIYQNNIKPTLWGSIITMCNGSTLEGIACTLSHSIVFWCSHPILLQAVICSEMYTNGFSEDVSYKYTTQLSHTWKAFYREPIVCNREKFI